VIINATIIVQAFNFCCIWLALYCVLLKPAFALLAKKNEEQKSIETSCSQLHAQILLLQENQYELHRDLHKQYLNATKNTVLLEQKSIDHSDRELFPVPHYTEQELSTLIDQAKEIIVARMRDYL
jgi:F0F1-type ATP synthase membrane subunit b/b'